MMAQGVVRAAMIVGIEALPVQVEVSVSSGLPGFTIVGMTDAAIQEARERIRAALRAQEFSVPNGRIVVNLAPGSLKKRGSGFDLSIAVGLLAATGQIPAQALEQRLFVGELSLTGEVRPVPGLLAYGEEAERQGCNLVCAASSELGVRADDGRVLLIKTLQDLRLGTVRTWEGTYEPGKQVSLDFADIVGHEQVKRALQIAAVGKHGLLMTGPPGSGKTMLASRLPSILPPLSQKELVEVEKIYSIAGVSRTGGTASERPFRAPHHSASTAGLIGGGNPLRPGEITLAHHGVLFLDELPEFKPSTLQSLRQPMESGEVMLVRADQMVRMPASFAFIAASNPCPCGHFGDKDQACTCSPYQISSYQNRIGGPILDRIDMRVMVNRLPSADVLNSGTGTASADLRETVMQACEFRSWRVSQREPADSRKGTLALKNDMDDQTCAYVEKLAERRKLSGRSLVRVLGVARTLADLALRNRIEKQDICEAAGLRFDDPR